MKRLVLASAAVLSLSGLGISAASADTIDRVQGYQEQQIRRGIASGQITRHEARDLIGEQRRIADMERRAKADGYVSPSDRARIADAQAAAGRHIYQESHDSERRGFRRWFSRWW